MKRVMLYGPNGRPIRQSVNPAWDASSNKRRASSWSSSSSGPKSIVADNMSVIRRRARQEVRNNAYAEAAVTSFVSNSVGLGIVPNPRVTDDAIREEIVDAWDDWVTDADADQRYSFYGLQAMVARAVKEAGEVFVRVRIRRADEVPSGVPLQIQLLESEMCDHGATMERKNRSKILNGIEFDRRGKRIGYWLWRSHPGDRIVLSTDLREKVRVPASRMLHVFPSMRPGQIRGISGMATVLARLHEIAEMEDAAILRTKIQNLYATFETVPDRDTSALDPTTGEVYDSQEGGEDSDVALVVAEPGSHVLLPPGHEVTMGKPPEGASDFEVFLRTELRAVAAGVGATYEQMTGDLTQVNFSSIRAGLIDLYRKIEATVEHVFVYQFCQPVWARWLEMAVMNGRISLPSDLMEPVAFRRLQRPQWTLTPGREYVDPEKEVKAAERAVQAGFLTRRKVVARMSGMDIADLERENAEDNARADEAGNSYTSDGRTQNVQPVEEEPGGEPEPGSESAPGAA